MYDISGSAHWNNMADVGLCVYRNFEDNTTIVYTKKVREQGLYGDIGEAMFEYDISTKTYKESLMQGSETENETPRPIPDTWYNKD